MRTSLLIAALGVSLAAPAVAQVADTQNPPAPNSSQNQPDATNSLPSGAATATGNRPGDAVGGSRTTPPATTTAPATR